MNNTFNLCLGHKLPPAQLRYYVDLMLSPIDLGWPEKSILVEDTIWGPNGDTLSEYAQLLWFYRNLDAIMGSCTHLRIFHYRRFLSYSGTGAPALNQPWSGQVRTDDLSRFEEDFNRNFSEEIFNTCTNIEANFVIIQYARDHIIEDFLDFARFLVSYNILTSNQCTRFVSESFLIPASNIGIFKKSTIRFILSVLNNASEYIYTPGFIRRNGYQRRNAGFLLERLNSFLILEKIRSGESRESFGNNIVISDESQISLTDSIT